jgi:Tol biopolymer transport system component/predicted Ser/Thr protein kinase
MIGEAIGSYRIVSELGAGGMGVVYRARDSRLGRDVAIKVLPPTVANDPDRRQRFEREARLLATLNHPHIAAIYGLEEQQGVVALVLELVEGPTLAELIESSGPKAQGSGKGLPLERALSIARQIADALDAAHERGIVHRDLKPSNIKLTPDGQVKVLDFGLAKIAESDTAASDLSHSPTITAGPTRAGVLLGTAAYMSPEQARGKNVDKRADIWAFGCVFFEMLAGTPAFARGTVTDTLAAVIERDPEWTKLPAATPAWVVRLLHSCLEKDPRRRLRDIGDAFAREVDAAETNTSAKSPARSRSTIAFAGIASALVAAAVTAGWLRTRAPAPTPAAAVRSTFDALTYDAGLSMMPAISPDGTMVAYASDRGGRGDLDIWVQQIGGGTPLRLTDDPSDDLMPDFSPDGRQIVFRSERDGGGLYLVSAFGGPARRIADGGRSPRFSPDGKRVAYWTGVWRGTLSNMASSSWVLTLADGTRTQLLKEFTGSREPVWAPDGKSLALLARPDSATLIDLWWVPLDGHAPVSTGALRPGKIGPLEEPGISTPMLGTWTANGVLFTNHNNIWSIPLTADTGVAGVPQPVTSGTGLYAQPSAARDGTLVFTTISIPRVVERAPLADGVPAVRLFADAVPDAGRPGETSDERMLLFERRSPSQREIWLRDTTTGAERLVVPVTDGSGPLNSTISADGARIAYTVMAAGDNQSGSAFSIAAAGGVPTRLCTRCTAFGFLSDNRRVLISTDAGARVIDTVTGAAQDILSTRGSRFARLHPSPDDRWIAFQYGGGVFVAPLTPGTVQPQSAWQKIADPAGTGRPCGWTLDAKTVLLLLDTDGFRCLWGQSIDAHGALVGQPSAIRHFHRTLTEEFSNSYGNAVTRNGFLYGALDLHGNVWRLVTAKK